MGRKGCGRGLKMEDGPCTTVVIIDVVNDHMVIARMVGRN